MEKLNYLGILVIIGVLLGVVMFVNGVENARKEARIEAVEEELMQCTRQNKTLEETFQMDWN